MPYKFCSVCGRQAHYFDATKSCSEHSDWPNPIMTKAHQLRAAGKAFIPAYSPEKDASLKITSVAVVKREVIPVTRIDWPEINLELEGREVPDGLHCTFCYKPLQEIEATYGQGKPRKVIRDEIVTVGDHAFIEEKITHVTDKMVACPDCILNIKPAVSSKDGRIINQGIKFLDFD